MEAKGNAAVVNALFDELDALGVREFCICAGARNAPLVDALVRSGLRIRHFFDERSAAFFALGRVMRGRVPAAVLTTSGTAAAELFPAVIEAHFQNLRLVAITADRPSRFAGSGAPQAIEQHDMFGEYVSRTVGIECAADMGVQRSVRDGRFDGGPVHFNVRLEEELGEFRSSNRESRSAGIGEDEPAGWNRDHCRGFFAKEGGIVALAGGLHPADVAAARDFLLRLNAPIVAEATANLHAENSLGRLLLRGGEKALRNSDFKRVVRIGCVPSWRWWRDLETREDVEVLNFSRGPFRGLGRMRNVMTIPWPALSVVDCVARTAPSVDGVIGTELDRVLEAHPNSEPAWMRHISRLIGSGATVFLGNSLPIREWNLTADRTGAGTAFFANRGANGIDGLVSTWLGVSADAAEAWLIVGDLSALYDMNAPWILSQLPAAKRRIVVLNNGGGKIFSHVRWLEPMSAEAKRVMANPHSISFEHWARMWGMDYRLFNDWRDLRDDDALCGVWEIRPDADETSAFWEAWR